MLDMLNVELNADISKKTKNIFLNKMEYIEGSLMKSSGKIPRDL